MGTHGLTTITAKPKETPNLFLTDMLTIHIEGDEESFNYWPQSRVKEMVDLLKEVDESLGYLCDERPGPLQKRIKEVLVKYEADTQPQKVSSGVKVCNQATPP